MEEEENEENGDMHPRARANMYETLWIDLIAWGGLHRTHSPSLLSPKNTRAARMQARMHTWPAWPADISHVNVGVERAGPEGLEDILPDGGGVGAADGAALYDPAVHQASRERFGHLTAADEADSLAKRRRGGGGGGGCLGHGGGGG